MKKNLKLNKYLQGVPPPTKYPYNGCDISLVLSYLRANKKIQSNILRVCKTQDVFSTPTNGKNLDFSPKYQYTIALAEIPKSLAEDIIIYTKKKGHLQNGLQNLVVRRSRKNLMKMKHREKWNIKLDFSGRRMIMLETYNPILPKLTIKSLNKNGLTFRMLVDFLADDTGKKSREIIDIAKASILPIPMSVRGKYAQFNIHSIILTNTSTGKSTMFGRLMGEEPTCDASMAGWLGGYMGEVATHGKLNGIGCLPADEFPEMNNQIIDKLLNYTIAGETHRDLVETVKVSGTKSIVFLGNCEETNLTGRLLMKSINTLARFETISRVGRRFPMIIYNNKLSRINEAISDVEAVNQARLLMEAIFDSSHSNIIGALSYCSKWFSKEDQKFREHLLGIAKYTNHTGLAELITGMSGATCRLKFAAVKVAIIDNFDLLVLKNDNNVKKKILSDAANQYLQFLDYIITSLSFIKEPSIELVKGLLIFHPEATNQELLDRLKEKGFSMSEPTLIKYKKQLRGDES